MTIVALGIVVFAHGSAVESANEAVRAVAAEMGRQGGYDLVEAGFLDCCQPDLAAAVNRILARGASSVRVVPYFLTLGTHVQRDLPRLVEEIRMAHPGLDISVAAPLDGHPGLAGILLARAEEEGF